MRMSDSAGRQIMKRANNLIPSRKRNARVIRETSSAIWRQIFRANERVRTFTESRKREPYGRIVESDYFALRVFTRGNS